MVLRFCIKLFSFVLNAQPNHYLLLKSAFGCWEYFFPRYVLKWRRAGIADHLLMLCSIVVLISNRWARILWLTFSVSLLTCTELPNPSSVVQALSVMVILKCDPSNFRGWELIPVLGREGDMHVGGCVCIHGCVFLWMCFGVVWFWLFDVAFSVWPRLPGKLW